MKILTNTLANGLTVVRVAMPGVQSTTVLALVNTGRRYEPEHWAGISHFLEHMVFKGTEKFENAQVLSATIDQVGGEFNAFTSKEYTGYYVKLASRDLEIAVDVVTDMLLTPKLRQEDIDREVKVIAEEMHMYEDMPMRSIGDIFEELFFGDSNLAGRILGTEEAIFSLKSADFSSYINQWYGMKNVVFVVAGDETVVARPETLQLIESLSQKGSAERKSEEQKPFWSGTYGSDRKRIVFKDTEQAHFILGVPALSRTDERRYALSVLSTLMGKTMSSRLFSEIREKRGLCYYVRSEMDFYHDTGMFGASAGVDPKRVEEAISATKAEFLALRSEKPVTQQEVDAAKRNIIGGMALELEDSQNVAAWVGMRQLLQGKTETPEEVVAKVEAVSLADVQALVEALIVPDQIRFALIGPFQPEDIKSI